MPLSWSKVWGDRPEAGEAAEVRFSTTRAPQRFSRRRRPSNGTTGDREHVSVMVEQRIAGFSDEQKLPPAGTAATQIQETASAGEDAQKQEPGPCGRGCKTVTPLWKQYGVSLKTKTRGTVRSNNSNSGISLKESKVLNVCRSRLIAALFTTAKMWKQPT